MCYSCSCFTSRRLNLLFPLFIVRIRFVVHAAMSSFGYPDWAQTELQLSKTTRFSPSLPWIRTKLLFWHICIHRFLQGRYEPVVEDTLFRWGNRRVGGCREDGESQARVYTSFVRLILSSPRYFGGLVRWQFNEGEDFEYIVMFGWHNKLKTNRLILTCFFWLQSHLLKGFLPRLRAVMVPREGRLTLRAVMVPREDRLTPPSTLLSSVC